MGVTVVKPRTVGRPPAKAMTVRIQPTGIVRLSPDLCTAKTFEVLADTARKQLIFKPKGQFTLWYSTPDGRSGLLTLAVVFDYLGMNPKDVAGEYVVTKVKDGFTVDLEHV